MLTPREREVRQSPTRSGPLPRSGWPRGSPPRSPSSGRRSPRPSPGTPRPTPSASGSSREIDAIEKTLPAPPPTPRPWSTREPEAPETFVLKRGDFEEPRPEGRAGPAADCPPDGIDLRPRARSDRHRPRPAVASPWQEVADQGRQPADRPGDREPALAGAISAGGSSPRPATSASGASRRPHPELLDWLATELVDRGWRLKAIHRLMVTSATYRQSSSGPARRLGEAGARTIPMRNSSGG